MSGSSIIISRLRLAALNVSEWSPFTCNEDIDFCLPLSESRVAHLDMACTGLTPDNVAPVVLVAEATSLFALEEVGVLPDLDVPWASAA